MTARTPDDMETANGHGRSSNSTTSGRSNPHSMINMTNTTNAAGNNNNNNDDVNMSPLVSQTDILEHMLREEIGRQIAFAWEAHGRIARRAAPNDPTSNNPTSETTQYNSNHHNGDRSDTTMS